MSYYREYFFSPISGGYFISQIAQMAMILEARAGKQPNAYFGASGGNIASIISLGFYQTKESLLKIASRLSSEFFVKEYLQGKFKYFDNPIFGINCYEGIRRPGIGTEELFDNLFSDEKIKTSPELWTLIYNNTKFKGEITCTKREEESMFRDYIKKDYIDKLGCGDIHYLDFSKELIAKVALASATIPGIRSNVEIWDDEYIDGGMSSASPGSFLCEAIRNEYKDYDDGSYRTKLHYFYFTSTDLDNDSNRKLFIKGKETDNSKKHWLINLPNQLKTLPVSSIYNDKRCLLENWLRILNIGIEDTTEKSYKNVNVGKLKEILDSNDSKHYFIETFSKDCFVDILNFNGEDLKEQFIKGCDSMDIKIIYYT